MDVLEQRFQRDRDALHFYLAHVGAGEEEQFVDDARHPVDFFEIALQDDCVVSRFPEGVEAPVRFPLS